MANVEYHEVLPDEAGQRLDNFLMARFRGVPRSVIYRVVRKGEVRINKGRVKPGYRLCSGDNIRIPPVRAGAAAAEEPVPPGQARQIEGSLIFEDDALIVVDKPAGLAVHGGSGISMGLIEMLRVLRPDAPKLELVHRLDRATSGCLLVAKKRAVLRALHGQLREGTVEKRYLALVCGQWQLGSRSIDAPLEVQHRQGGERFVRVHEDGKSARTHFRPVEIYRDATLLEATLDTGRTHQIRVHAAWAEHPLAGDQRYGSADCNEALGRLGLKRLFLHASALGFIHPASGEPQVVSAPLPPELTKVLEGLPMPKGKTRRAPQRSKG